MAHQHHILIEWLTKGYCSTVFTLSRRVRPPVLALMTGRHPVRTGLTDVIFPGNPAGLSPEEVTIAELLSEGGYATAMYGKWHLGEGEETWPHNQGFDETLFGVFSTPHLGHGIRMAKSICGTMSICWNFFSGQS